MSGSIIPTPDYKAADGQSFGTQVEKQRLGFIGLSLTNYDNNSVPQIAAGSCVEISGSIFQFPSNDSITGTPSSGNINYIMLTVSGSGDSQTVEASWTTTSPSWNTSKQGWYDATNAKRYVGGCYFDGTNYTGKWVYDKNDSIEHSNGSKVLKLKVIEIGDWNMDITVSVEVIHGLTRGSIRTVTGMVRNDDDTLCYSIPRVRADGTDVDCMFSSVNSTRVEIVRRTGGIFDSNSYDATSYNRGWIVIWYEV